MLYRGTVVRSMLGNDSNGKKHGIVKITAVSYYYQYLVL